MLAKQFIDQLESQGLLSPEIVEELRRQVEESKSRITPEVLARLLVDNGHLTKFQATKLVSELKNAKDSGAKPASPKDAPSKGAALGKPEAEKAPKTSLDEMDLGLAPLEQDSPKESASKDKPGGNKRSAAIIIDDSDDDEVAAEVIEEAVEVVEVVPEAVEVVEIIEPEPVQVVEVVEVGQSEPVSPGPKSLKSLQAGKAGRPSGAKSPAVPRPGSKSQANPWDSHRILTTSVVLALVVAAGIGLVFYFTRTSAEDRLKLAEEAYEKRSYETAATMYREFVANFGGHEKVSFAKVREALAQMRRDTESAPDPTIGLKTAQSVLPTIVEEPALNPERGDLTGVLVALAEKFNERADSAKETEKKKALMSDMEKLNQILNDPRFVGSTERNQQVAKLARIEEDRQRILRDINRDEELTKTLAAIDEKLNAKATADAYQLRRDLVNRYPQLEKDPGLSAQVQKATQIQQSLVSSVSPKLKLALDAPAPSKYASVMLANRRGGAKELTAMKGKTVYVKVKGTVYALDGSTGNVKWHQYTGKDAVDAPVRLGEGNNSDIALSRSGLGQLSRLSAEDGKAKWFLELGGPSSIPVADGEDLFVAMRDGSLLNLDAQSGQSKWSVKIPQPVEVAPGVSTGKPHIYVPGEHSNLYVMNRQNGKCDEVYYLGHRAGTITVPPILLLGQLFVFENAGADYAMIRILQTSDNGLELKANQPPIRVKGNIVVAPQIDGRRLLVITDRGEIRALDIEPTAEKQKVSELNPILGSESQPRLSWAIAGNNMVWIASDRFTRYDVQVTRSQLARIWNKDDGDQFTGQPQKFDDVIVHTRIVRGTRGVRVAAISSQTGDVLWQTDLGVPVTALANSKDKPVALTTSGALFSLDPTQPIRNGADADPEAAKLQLLYTDPVRLKDDELVMLNQSAENRVAIYKPTGDKSALRIVIVNFLNGKPTCLPTAVGKGFCVGLDNGPIAVIDPSNGAYAVQPFQPPVEPGKKVRWTRPAFDENNRVLFATGSLQKLYRIGVSDALRALSEVDLEQPIASPLVEVGGNILGVVTSKSQDTLQVFESGNLAKVKDVPLTGRWIAGPFKINDQMALVQTDKQLIGLGVGGSQLWVSDFPKSTLAAIPSLEETGIVLTTTAGLVRVINPADGKSVREVNAGQPLSSAPLFLSTGMLLGSDEGTVITVPPTGSESGGN